MENIFQLHQWFHQIHSLLVSNGAEYFQQVLESQNNQNKIPSFESLRIN